MEQRNFIEVDSGNGDIKKVEVICELKSKSDNKTYVVITEDEEIDDEINVSIAYIYERNEKVYLELIEDEDELNYAYSLMNEMLKEG